MEDDCCNPPLISLLLAVLGALLWPGVSRLRWEPARCLCYCPAGCSKEQYVLWEYILVEFNCCVLLKFCKKLIFNNSSCSSAPRGYCQHRDQLASGEFRKEACSEYSQTSSRLFILCIWRVSNQVQRFLHPRCSPVCNLVCPLCRSTLIVDPTDEEENLSTAQITVVMDEGDRLCAVHKPGERTDARTHHLYVYVLFHCLLTSV